MEWSEETSQFYRISTKIQSNFYEQQKTNHYKKKHHFFIHFSNYENSFYFISYKKLFVLIVLIIESFSIELIIIPNISTFADEEFPIDQSVR